MSAEDLSFYEVPVKLGYLDVTFFLSDNFLVSSNSNVSPVHNHPDYELYYIISGICRITIDGKLHHAAAGDFLLLHPSEYHCRESVPSSQFNFRFSVKEPSEKSKNATSSKAYSFLTETLNRVRHLRGRDSIIFTLLNQLHKELMEKAPGYVGNLQSLCSLLLTEILRLSKDIPDWFFPVESERARDYDSVAIDDFFSTHSLGKIKIQDLADELKVSIRQVNRILHRLYGMSFTQKLTEMRLWEVARQLTLTQRSITAISQDCGFNNYNYFYVCFREKFGMTPTEYRAQKTNAAKR